jgi:predicted solute-binding protein
MPADSDLFDDLADAWYKLQQAPIVFEGLDPKAPDFREKLGELRGSLAEYERVIERIERRAEREEHP